MYADRDLDPIAPLPLQTDGLIQDLQLDPLLDTMGVSDQFVRDMGLAGLDSPPAFRDMFSLIRGELDDGVAPVHRGSPQVPEPAEQDQSRPEHSHPA